MPTVLRKTFKARAKAPVQTTFELGNLSNSHPAPPDEGRPTAKRTLQAQRIAVNDELGSLRTA